MAESERHDPHADESMVGPHGAPDDQGADHGDDDHAEHGGAVLGPIDIPAWGALLVGIALGLVMLLAFVQALS